MRETWSAVCRVLRELAFVPCVSVVCLSWHCRVRAGGRPGTADELHPNHHQLPSIFSQNSSSARQDKPRRTTLGRLQIRLSMWMLAGEPGPGTTDYTWREGKVDASICEERGRPLRPKRRWGCHRARNRAAMGKPESTGWTKCSALCGYAAGQC